MVRWARRRGKTSEFWAPAQNSDILPRRLAHLTIARKKNKEKKGAGVGIKKNWAGVGGLNPGGPDHPPVLPHKTCQSIYSIVAYKLRLLNTSNILYRVVFDCAKSIYTRYRVLGPWFVTFLINFAVVHESCSYQVWYIYIQLKYKCCTKKYTST